VTELKETVLIEDLTLANVIWRKFGRQPEGFLEKVLNRNPGIAGHLFIPVGTEIVFPVTELSEASADVAVVRLWD